MDPITLQKLFSFADQMESRCQGNELLQDEFIRITSEQTRAKDLVRRRQDLLRVFSELGWIQEEPSYLLLTPQFKGFIEHWNVGKDLLAMNQYLSTYVPYQRFLSALEAEEVIQIPKGSDKFAKQVLGKKLYEKYKITFVAFDVFTTWSVPMGQAYISNLETDKKLYWGGAWDHDQPSLDLFESNFIEAYNKSDKTSGYASIGSIADVICRQMKLSFQFFEAKLNYLIEKKPDLIIGVPSTIREPSYNRRQSDVNQLRPRTEILRERVEAHLRGLYQAPSPRWFNKRFVEDGVYINGNLVKLVKRR